MRKQCETCQITDAGPKPYADDFERLCEANRNFRTVLWTGHFFQITLMCIPVCGEIGLEIHPDTDQLLYVVSGTGLAQMGMQQKKLDYSVDVRNGFGIVVPAGTWHNLTNTGRRELKLISVYAPPHHPHGTVHKTKAEADMAED